MDPPAESEPDFSLVSTNNAQWTSYSGGFLPLLSPFFPSTLPTMYPQAESEPDFSVLSTNNPQWTSYAGTFLPQASAAFTRSVSNHYHITGGVGGPGGDAQDQGTGGSGGSGHGPTLNFYNSSKESLSPFRTILLGDLDLVKCLDGQSGVGRRRNQRAGVRRMYSANLVVRESERKVTVAIYQGNGAEEEWRRDYAAYESIRHPNILQLYGVVNSKKLCAIVFHDELIPYDQFLRRFEHSPILTTYILGYCRTDWDEAADYHYSIFPMTYHEWRLTYDDFPLWIRPATGQLCVELSLGQQERDDILLDAPRQDGILRLENISLDVPNAESLAISSLDERKYHHLCSVYPMAQFQRFSISPRLPIWYWPTLSLLDFKRRALLMVTKPLDFGPDAEFVWEIDQTHEALPKSWMRFDSRQAYDLHLRLSVHSRNSLNFWLAQANYIFSQLQTTSNLDDYVFVYMTTFRLRCLPKPQAQQLQGYLFICPPGDIRTGENSCKWPDCPAYWSLDPSGAVPLSSEDAKTFGFPIIHIETLVKGYSWDDSVYQGLQQFHTGKGFDPDSQDMARDLGYPLFELSTEEVPPLAYVEGGLEEGPWHCDLEDPARCQALGHYV